MNRNENTIFYYFRTGKVITWQELEDIFAHRVIPQGSIGILNKNQIARMNNGYILKIDPPEPKPVVIPQDSLLDDSFIEIVNRHSNEMKIKELREAQDELYRMKQERHTEEERRVAYEKARLKSTQGAHVKRSQNKKTIRNKIIVNALILVISTSLVCGAIDLGKNVSDSFELHNANQSVGYMLAEGSVHHPSIVSQNTYRTNDNEGFWYKNDDIARDILQLPDELFETILYITYKDMGSYTNNMDDVIRFLDLFTADDPQSTPVACGHVNGCSTFNDYLIKNGFVDDEGKPSIEKFEEHGKAQISAHREYLEQLANDGKGTRS